MKKIYHKDTWGFWFFRRYSFYVGDEFDSLSEILVDKNIWIKHNVGDYFVDNLLEASISELENSVDRLFLNTLENQNKSNPASINLNDIVLDNEYLEYPEILGSWDDTKPMSGIESKIEKNLGKIVSKFKILHHEWEMDGYGYIIDDRGEKRLAISDHGAIRIADKEYLNELIKNYKEVIQETERALFLLK